MELQATLWEAEPIERPWLLPSMPETIKVPPIKSQGIKTKLVPFIMSSIQWSGHGRWIEPFIGSAAVVLNVMPKRAILTDTNEHVIRFYHDVTTGAVTPKQVEHFLTKEGAKLLHSGETYYYEVRERFNQHPTSLDFLFLNRSGFNGLIRFNAKGEYNVPSGRKPERFRKAYVTKVVNQVAMIASIARRSDWVFAVADWKKTVTQAKEGDFIYADPPYIGRHTGYYNGWSEAEAKALFLALRAAPCGFALSTWKKNEYRANPYFPDNLTGLTVKSSKHFYHVGSTESLRHAMEEALIISEDHAVCPLLQVR